MSFCLRMITNNMIDKKKLDAMLKRVVKPARYIGNETNLIVKDNAKVRFAFAFPDMYEIGMSYVGLQILYDVINSVDDVACERVFAPDTDMEELMRAEGMPLFSLETKREIASFDLLGFTLQYEMSFTNILNMLDLAGLPLAAADRGDDMPVVMAGGPCAYNPEPLAKFFDFFIIGDGELIQPELCRIYRDMKDASPDGRVSKSEYIAEVSKLRGIYVPSYYDVEYNEDGTVKSYTPNREGVPERVTRSLIDDLEDIPYPKKPMVPIINVVHDRAVVETFRGCTRGCRFCQAGMIYRPVRERSPEKIYELAKSQLDASGHDELSLLSLSTSDYSKFEELAVSLMEDCRQREVALSLPSLRLDSFSFRVLDEIQGYRKSGLTFAPEAGSQRLRDVINKNITEENIYSSLSQAMDLGWNRVKLYFMMGLPQETYEDLEGIAEIAKNIMDMSREKRAGKGRFSVSVSVSNFVPKPHTPFQWEPQDTRQSFVEKHNFLSDKLHIRGVQFNYHDSPVSYLEAVVARGDRKTADLIEQAWKNGCKFDSWSESFNYEGWEKAFEQTGIDGAFYANRRRSYDEVLPWDVIDSGITKEFLMRENEKAKAASTTPDCRHGCQGCGINKLTECKLGGIYGK